MGKVAFNAATDEDKVTPWHTQKPAILRLGCPFVTLNGMTNKQLVIETVRELPDGTSLDEIAERIAILAAIRKGEEDADAGRVISHEELKRRMKTWISK
jgi:hypothetical protein